MNSAAFLDQLKNKYALTSDYQLGKFLGISHSRISMYRTERREFDDATCRKVDALLDYPEGYILLTVQAARAKDAESRSLWLKMGELLMLAEEKGISLDTKKAKVLLWVGLAIIGLSNWSGENFEIIQTVDAATVQATDYTLCAYVLIYSVLAAFTIRAYRAFGRVRPRLA